MNIKDRIIAELLVLLVAVFDGFFWAVIFYLFGVGFKYQVIIFFFIAAVVVILLHAIPCDCDRTPTRDRARFIILPH